MQTENSASMSFDRRWQFVAVSGVNIRPTLAVLNRGMLRAWGFEKARFRNHSDALFHARTYWISKG